jgi:hypothetical protein
VTFTYDNTDLSTDLAKVRSAIGDVSEHPHYSLTDEEITANINAAPTLAVAKYLSARDRHARALIWATRNAASITADRRGTIDSLKQLTDQLLKDAGGQAAVIDYGNVDVSAGMMSQDSIDNARDDADYPDPPFRIGMDDNRGASADENELTDG